MVASQFFCTFVLVFSFGIIYSAYICWRWAVLPIADQTFRFRITAESDKFGAFQKKEVREKIY